MADPAAAQRSSGYVVGGISPVGQKRALPTVVDESAARLDVLHVSGTVASEDAKKKLWDEYSRLDPEMRSGDLVLNVEVGGGGAGGWGEDAEQSYTVKSGDTISKIGNHYGVAWRDIHEANKDVIGSDPDKIHPGQTLRIPKK